ncbi:hypothetical protein EOE67_15360 [Rheinheimera riviphila]|uniref:Uncharacterized protein n=1 Tax=Rheinheimera riviphila TaxID=1834037 RepID=A0A437QIW1_9GAMM|nr:hypothetical protein [Rheinheimera riviphila]RVU34423.1 hypothetical protein EOE67_15360 [Rheinheimera riviphila]
MQQANWIGMVVLSTLSMAFGIFFLFFHESQLQAEADLLQVSGQVSWVETHRYSINFALKEHPQVFSYSKGAGAAHRVRRALEVAGGKVVVLRYEKATHGPIFSDDRYHSVWEIQINQQLVRSYPQIASAIAAGEKLKPWLGWFFVCSGGYLAYVARQTRRAQRLNSSFNHLFPWT